LALVTKAFGITCIRRQNRFKYVAHCVTPSANFTTEAFPGTFKEKWESAKKRAGVSCRWHDLQHTFCTRLLEGGTAFPIVAAIMGWSAATTVRMAQRYGHLSADTLSAAVAVLDSPKTARI
jgi:integrase